MPTTSSAKTIRESKNALATARIFFLDLGAGRILSANPDGSDIKVVIPGGQKHPDGIAVDAERGYLYWTNMGNPAANDGSIVRSKLDGGNITFIVAPGGTFTPKQIQIELKSQKLYWSDREGMRVMRCSLDGSRIETLIETGHTEEHRRDATRWCVGIAVDPDSGKIYWTQKGGDNAGEGRIFRAGIELPAGETPATRTDIELLYDNLSEPIDLDLDTCDGMLYWTDRGDPPRGNTVNRAPMSPSACTESQILISHLMEGIGLALDLRGRRLFVTDLAGSVYTASLDGFNPRMLMAVQGNLSGIAYAELPEELSV
jgi:sugar lactone lactonase YvrE